MTKYPTRDRFRSLAVGLSAAALALGTLAACGSDGADAEAKAGVEELVIAVGTANSAHAPLYIAEARGYFADENLKITLRSGASDVQALTSGQVDLSYGGVTSAAIPAAAGKPTSVLFATSGGGVTIWTVGRPGIDSIEDCERLGTYPEGSSTYAWSNVLNEGFELDAEFLPFTEAPARAAALVASTIDCANGSASGLEPLVDKGDAKWLVRPDEPGTLPANFVDGVAEVGVIGMQDRIKEKRDAIVGFLSALMKASDDLKNDTPEQVAKDLKKAEAFAAFDEAALAKAIEIEAPVMIPNDGYIEESGWEATLGFLGIAGLDLDVSDKALSYANMVDMSLYDEAKS